MIAGEFFDAGFGKISASRIAQQGRTIKRAEPFQQPLRQRTFIEEIAHQDALDGRRAGPGAELSPQLSQHAQKACKEDMLLQQCAKFLHQRAQAIGLHGGDELKEHQPLAEQ